MNSLVRWHKVKYRPMTDEEVKDASERYGISEDEFEHIYFDCPMPEDGQEILVATHFCVDKDICCEDDYGIGLEIYGDWEGIYAWAEMPKYDEEESCEKCKHIRRVKQLKDGEWIYFYICDLFMNDEDGGDGLVVTGREMCECFSRKCDRSDCFQNKR